VNSLFHVERRGRIKGKPFASVRGAIGENESSAGRRVEEMLTRPPVDRHRGETVSGGRGDGGAGKRVMLSQAISFLRCLAMWWEVG